MDSPTPILYKNTGSLKIGDVQRFIITYTPTDITNEIGSNLFIKVKNIENFLMNSVILTGPYTLYCDIKSNDYNHNKECFITDDQPVYEPNIIPGQSLIHKLTLNKLNNKFIWIIDIISQIIFSTSAEINFELLISKNELNLHKNYSNLKNNNFNPENLNIQHLTTLDLWNKPPHSLIDPIHLIILTHGLHSNSSADMFYIKEQLENLSIKTGENIVIRAYFDNVCKTERGIKYLGRRLAEFIKNDSIKGLNENNIKKISFIGHSLGGPVQTFAISYINFNYPEFFKKIRPENFITLASPLLGISNENPAYVKVFLKFGIVGKTGQDLNLEGNQPLLLLLPSENTRKILKLFKRRTVYANVLNDGIVPLRTSALLYLDWKGLTKVYEALHSNPNNLLHYNHNNNNNNNNNNDNNDNDKEYIREDEINNVNNQASEIPVDLDNEFSTQDKNQLQNNIEINNDKTLIDSIKNKIQSTIGYCLPNMQAPKTTQKYNYFQTTSSNEFKENSSSIENMKNDNSVDVLKEKLTSIPKSSVITSIKKVLLPPSPSSKYINDPKSRYDVILHDKIYTPDMIPKKHTTLSKNIIVSQLEQNKRHRFFEEKIARRWHQDMSWRKVLVYLQPDAHNNMVVRRRFSNAYGWQVIDHMVEQHFGENSFKGKDLSLWELKKSNDKFIDLDATEINELNKKFSKVMNKEFSKEYKSHLKHKDFHNKSEKNKTNNNNILENENLINNDDDGNDNDDNDNDNDNDNKDNDNDNDNINNDTQSIISYLTIEENDASWLNETGSGYYDGPTNLLNTVNEGMTAWKESVLNPPEIIDSDSSQIDNNPAIVSTKDMKELNEFGEMNAYI
jgi:hypothetical protein